MLIFTIVYLTRAIQALQQWGFLSSLPLSVSPLYLLATGVVWGALGMALVVGLWLGLQWAPWALRIAALAIALNYWLERTLLAASPLKDISRPFAIGATAALLASIFALLSVRKVRRYFGEIHDR